MAMNYDDEELSVKDIKKNNNCKQGYITLPL